MSVDLQMEKHVWVTNDGGEIELHPFFTKLRHHIFEYKFDFNFFFVDFLLDTFIERMEFISKTVPG